MGLRCHDFIKPGAESLIARLSEIAGELAKLTRAPLVGQFMKGSKNRFSKTVYRVERLNDIPEPLSTPLLGILVVPQVAQTRREQ